MTSSKTMFASFVALIFFVTMLSNSVMGRPTETIQINPSTTNKAVDVKTVNLASAEKAVVVTNAGFNKTDGKVIAPSSEVNNPEKPTLITRERRWDGCGYKGMC
ncbi:unnamed protein product [Orchesella dallaii]|uniref:Uncharacterized protein n=1 Tax=Orchesella dallaii TaxID=48710 RepID=A0ABP1QJ82_9HEXA